MPETPTHDPAAPAGEGRPSATSPAPDGGRVAFDFATWVGAIESFDEAVASAARSLSEYGDTFKTDAERARHVLWIAGVDHMWKHIEALRLLRDAQALAGPAAGARAVPPMPGIYIASKAVHGPRWRELRDAGWPIFSTWIDEAEAGRTADWADLWDRCAMEPARAAATILYREPGEEMKGALVEVGAALSHSRKVILVGPVPHTWAKHRNVSSAPNLDTALSLAMVEVDRVRRHDSPVPSQAAPAAAGGTGSDLGSGAGLPIKWLCDEPMSLADWLNACLGWIASGEFELAKAKIREVAEELTARDVSPGAGPDGERGIVPPGGATDLAEVEQLIREAVALGRCNPLGSDCVPAAIEREATGKAIDAVRALTDHIAAQAARIAELEVATKELAEGLASQTAEAWKQYQRAEATLRSSAGAGVAVSAADRDVLAERTTAPYRARQCHLSGHWNVEREYVCINGLSAWFVVVVVYAAEEFDMGWSDGAIGTAEDRAHQIADALNAVEAARHVEPRIRFRIEAAQERGADSITIGLSLAREVVRGFGGMPQDRAAGAERGEE